MLGIIFFKVYADLKIKFLSNIDYNLTMIGLCTNLSFFFMRCCRGQLISENSILVDLLFLDLLLKMIENLQLWFFYFKHYWSLFVHYELRHLIISHNTFSLRCFSPS